MIWDVCDLYSYMQRLRCSRVLRHPQGGKIQLPKTCALRAPTMFLVRIKNIRTKNTVMDKSNSGLGLSKNVDRVRMAFHPRAIDDPRGRFFVRAKSQLYDNGEARFELPIMYAINHTANQTR